LTGNYVICTISVRAKYGGMCTVDVCWMFACDFGEHVEEQTLNPIAQFDQVSWQLSCCEFESQKHILRRCLPVCCESQKDCLHGD
jgi:hypothetical protein